MTLKNKIKLAALLTTAFLAGDYCGVVRSRRKSKNIINYYEKELMKNAFYADAFTWARENMNRLTPEELQRGLRQRLLHARTVSNGS